jgi:hypothetical protein|tara:strand:- start:488 stop:799 length:312 start_codon:yes stop_codon:yes gene_type:complete
MLVMVAAVVLRLTTETIIHFLATMYMEIKTTILWEQVAVGGMLATQAEELATAALLQAVVELVLTVVLLIMYVVEMAVLVEAAEAFIGTELKQTGFLVMAAPE